MPGATYAVVGLILKMRMTVEFNMKHIQVFMDLYKGLKCSQARNDHLTHTMKKKTLSVDKDQYLN